MNPPQLLRVHAATAPRDPRLAEVLAGLRARPRRLSSTWLYDAEGSALFERITELPEYYLTRTELEILAAALPEIARVLGTEVLVVEPGSGSGRKTEQLLAALTRPSGYTAIDVSSAALTATAPRLRARFPDLQVQTVVADFTALAPGLGPCVGDGNRLVFFPGSTIGNFEPEAALGLLRSFHALAGADGHLLLGADLAKDPAILLPAYDDAAGVTAAFNRNLLVHLNHALGADFLPEHFAHRVRFDRDESRIEMHLESLEAQRITISDERFAFERGERIHTENSYKHAPERVVDLAARACWREVGRWTDARDWFGVFLFAAAAAP